MRAWPGVEPITGKGARGCRGSADSSSPAARRPRSGWLRTARASPASATSWGRMSAPISQTKCALRIERAAAPAPCRACSACRAAARAHRPGCADGGAICRARATRVASGSMPSSVFSGFCGETSHHTSSRPSRFSASRLIWRWPSCAGLNEPPSRPMRRARIARHARHRMDRDRDAHRPQRARCRARCSCRS